MLDMIARSMERLSNKSAKEQSDALRRLEAKYDFTLDTTRAQEELGYKPIVTLDTGIERTAARLRDHDSCRVNHCRMAVQALYPLQNQPKLVVG